MSTVAYVPNSLASWDGCMANSYCKYPVIVGFVVGGLVLLTVLYCLARCMCCGGSCCGLCRRRKKQKGGAGYTGFQPGPPPPVPYSNHPQYEQKQPPYVQQSPYTGPQTATFAAPAKSPSIPGRYHEDSLPAMPSWSDAKTKHVEEEHVEMDRLDAHDTPQQPQGHLLSGYDDHSDRFSNQQYSQQNYAPSPPIGYAQPYQPASQYGGSNYAPSAAHYSRPGTQEGSQYGHVEQPAHPQSPTAFMPTSPYEEYVQHQQYAAMRSASATRSPPPVARSPLSEHQQYAAMRSASATRSPPPVTRSPAPQNLHRTPSQSTAGNGSVLPLYSQPISQPMSPQLTSGSGYAPSSTAYAPSSIPSSIVPPSYHTRASSATRSPPPQPPTEYGGSGTRSNTILSLSAKLRQITPPWFRLAALLLKLAPPLKRHRSQSVPTLAPQVTSWPGEQDGVEVNGYLSTPAELPFLKELRKSKGYPYLPFIARRRIPKLTTVVSLLLVLIVLLIPSVPTVNHSLRELFTRQYPLSAPASCPPVASELFLQDLYCKVPPQVHKPGSLYSKSPSGMALAQAAARVAAEFEYTKEDVNRGVREFIRQMDEGLGKTGATMSQIPTYVTAVPNGTEKGLYMAVDLGGTNFRVCSVQLHGNSTFSLTQSKVPIPKTLMVAKQSRELFAFLAKQIEAFLKQHHGEHYSSHIERRSSFVGPPHDKDIFSLGFTFSFPVQQYGINKGTLIRWTKGFDIPDAVGKDVCALLQQEIDRLGLPVRVAALVNDTVGTLMARSYTSPGKTGTLLGAIFGTGTNGAYVQKLDKISKLTKTDDVDTTTGEMIVNTEWGSFDNQLSVLPNTKYDQDLDKESVNPGIQMFEKRISGMFLGEILRRALVSLVKDPKVPLFSDEHSNQNDVHSTTNIDTNSPIMKRWGLDTSFLSITSGDNSAGLKVTRQTLDNDYGVSAASAEDAEAVRLIATAIGKRAARLSAVAIAAVVISTDKLHNPTDIATTNDATLEVNEDDIVDIGVDGSLVEFYPGFDEYIREALREIPEIGRAGEKRIRIGIAKDGSGVGAALIALVADKARRGSIGGAEQQSGLQGLLAGIWHNINRGIRSRV